MVYLHNDLFEDRNAKLRLAARVGRGVCGSERYCFAVIEVNRLGMLTA